MKAIIYKQYGSPDVLRMAEVEKPVPKDSEILVRVKATSVGYGDWLARNFAAVTPRKFNMPSLFWLMAKFYFGFYKPKVNILGSVFSGEVESVGKEVKLFRSGDQVFGFMGQQMGTYAEYLCIDEKGCVTQKPGNMTHEEASLSVYGPLMALPLIKKAHIKPGQKVLVIGASGGIGSAAVQIARHYGATVTGVCGTNRIDYVRSLGADIVLDYNLDDYTLAGQSYDLIFDVLGSSSFDKCKKSLSPGGVYFLVSFKIKQLLQMAGTGLLGGKRVICSLAPGNVKDLIAVKDLIENGKLRAVIDKHFNLEEMAEAHRYYESPLRKGNIAITIN